MPAVSLVFFLQLLMWSYVSLQDFKTFWHSIASMFSYLLAMFDYNGRPRAASQLGTRLGWLWGGEHRAGICAGCDHISEHRMLLKCTTHPPTHPPTPCCAPVSCVPHAGTLALVRQAVSLPFFPRSSLMCCLTAALPRLAVFYNSTNPTVSMIMFIIYEFIMNIMLLVRAVFEGC